MGETYSVIIAMMLWQQLQEWICLSVKGALYVQYPPVLTVL